MNTTLLAALAAFTGIIAGSATIYAQNLACNKSIDPCFNEDGLVPCFHAGYRCVELRSEQPAGRPAG